MRRILRPYVAAELDEAASWYDERSSGLGHTFIDEVENTLARVALNPTSYQTIHLTIRRAPVHRFPYGVYFTIIQDAIHVLAVVHDARHPTVWKRRR